jgi:hypothetical protein
MSLPTADRLHKKLFPVYIPEYYVSKISPYFMSPRPARPPMVNGVPVTMDEYNAVDPEFVPDTEFIPEPIYSPMENNLTYSFKSTANIYDAYINDVNVRFENPENMLEMINIIEEYILATARYEQIDSNVKIWNDSLREFEAVLRYTYNEFIRKRGQRLPKYRQNLPGSMQLDDLLSLFKGS